MSIEKTLNVTDKFSSIFTGDTGFADKLRDTSASDDIKSETAMKTIMARLDEAAVNVRKGAQPKSIKRCAEHVREALEKAGFKIENTNYARNYGPKLEAAGFAAVAKFTKSGDNDGDFPKGYMPQKGDVVIIQPCPKHPIGHMTMFDGTQWVSDFKQKDMWSGGAYRTHKPDYVVYRAQSETDTAIAAK